MGDGRDDVLESYIRQYIEAHDTPVVNFAWQGGEPTLLGGPMISGISSKSKRNMPTASRSPTPSRPMASCSTMRGKNFFLEYQFLIGISIHFPRELHDAFREDKGASLLLIV